MRLRVLVFAALLGLPFGFGFARADRVLDAIALLQSDNFKVRAQAALALGGQGTERDRVVRPLVRALRDEHRVVRTAASIALGKLGEITTVPALAELVGDEDRTVADVARKATESIVSAFLAARGRFDDRRWAIHVSKLNGDLSFKDQVVERLLERKNVDVGATMAFEEEGAPLAAELELVGEFVELSSSRGTLRLTLALKGGGAVLCRWDRLEARGTSRDDVMKTAAGLVASRVLGFLGG